MGILGALLVSRDGIKVDLAGIRRRALVCRLAVAGGRPVPAGQLAEDLWEGRPGPATPATLQSHISHLRRLLGPQQLVYRDGGYVLEFGADGVDAVVFDREFKAGLQQLAAGDPAGAAGLLHAALGRWRGAALADVAGQLWAAGEITRLEELRLQATEALLDARLALGEHDAVVTAAEAAVAQQPLRERLWSQLMLALYRSGRQADALRAYQRLRRHLSDELGLQPGPDIAALEGAILRQDPTLDAPAKAAVLARAVIVPRELPADVEGFTSREAELAELDWLLPVTACAAGEAPGLVVISAVSGTAGVGKTALAVRWAHRVTDSFPDGQLYVNLRGYDPDQPMLATEALAGFLRALGVAGADIPLEEAERAGRYRSLVAGRRLLVVLDNAATVEQVRPLLPGSSSVMTLVTSRDSMAGLVARDGAHRLDLDVLPAADAVTLLYTLIGQRAEVDPAAAAALAAQCARLPLALRVAAELAVARPDTPLAGLVVELAGLQDRLELLDAGGDPRTAVVSVFSWSYRHLPPQAGRMFRLLGLHPGADWDRYAAAALAGTGVTRAGQQLAVLARAHLIQPAGADRYGMHDLLRGYAAGLAAGSDSDQARQAALTGLFDYYLAACGAAMDCLAPFARHHRPDHIPAGTPVPAFGDQSTAVAWLDTELATLSAVTACTATRGWPGHTTRLAGTLYLYLATGHETEGLTICTRALAAARDSGDRAAQARVLNNLGAFHYRQGHHLQATDCHQQALAVARDIGDRHTQARGLAGLATVHDQQGRYQQAAHRYRQALSLFRELDDQLGELVTLGNIGVVYLRQSRYQQAADHFQQVLTLARQIGDEDDVACALGNLGEICYLQGRYQQAADHLRQALPLSRQTGNQHCEAEVLTRLGGVYRQQGHLDQAADYHQQALALCQEIGNRDGEADALNGTGETALAAGQPGQARVSHAAALALTRQTGNRREQARALARLGEVSYRQGQYDQAAEYHQQSLALFRELGSSDGEADALNGAGETYLAVGQPGQARDCYTTALTLARQTGDRYQQARAHHGLADAAHAAGDLSQAHEHGQHARHLYTALGIPDPSRMPAGQPGPAKTT